MDTKMNIKIKKLHPDAIIPKYATKGSACFDLHACLNDDEVYISSHSDYYKAYAVIDTWLAFEIPEDYVMLVYSRSGHAFKNNVRLANSVAVIDSDFRGSVKVKLTADEDGCLQVKHGDRIAQAMIIPINQVEFEEVSELSETERGQGGFGSTGK